MRTMILLPDHHHAEAKRRAAREGISLSEYVRRLVARDIERDAAAGDPSAIFGLFDSGRIQDRRRQAGHDQRGHRQAVRSQEVLTDGTGGSSTPASGMRLPTPATPTAK